MASLTTNARAGSTVIIDDPSNLLHNQCYFLQWLPQELRDMIYELVLTEEGGLFSKFDPRSGGPPKLYPRRSNEIDFYSRPPTVEANQLKFVCRQLYYETEGIEVKFNDLRFYAWRSRSGAEVCEHFLLNMAGSLTRHIRRITIVENPFSSSFSYHNQGLIITGRLFPAIYSFCYNHPKARVQIRLNLRSDYTGAYENMLSLSFALTCRGFPSSRPEANELLDAIGCSVPTLESLRIALYSEWHKDVAREYASSLNSSFTPEDIDRVLLTLRRLIRDGC